MDICNIRNRFDHGKETLQYRNKLCRVIETWRAQNNFPLQLTSKLMANPKLLIKTMYQISKAARKRTKYYHVFRYQNIIQTSDLVAPPTMNINILCPIFLKSLDECLSTESLYDSIKRWKSNVRRFGNGRSYSSTRYLAIP